MEWILQKGMNMNLWKLDLAGEWSLTGTPEAGAVATREVKMAATVPGNIEIDLQTAGIIDDPFYGCNAVQVRPFEYYRWRFEREFVCAELPGAIDLVLDGVDCLAEISINGEHAGSIGNALIPHRLPVARLLRQGVNHIAIEIASPSAALHDYPMEGGILGGTPFNYQVLRFRKPAHSWGWDIAPRLPLGGIYRSLRLEEVPLCRIAEDRLQLLRLLPEGSVELLYQYKIENGRRECRNLRLVLEGRCGDSVWRHEEAVLAPLGHVFMVLPAIRLWYPRGYGDPNLYEVTITLLEEGSELARHEFTTGFRLVELVANECIGAGNEPDFQLKVNGIPIRVHGTNHVPADALHSRDKERLPEILKLLDELGCNMVRMWGGSVYEIDEFYDFCDRRGILIWQDFMMACGVYPRDLGFVEALSSEAVAVIRRLRHHPSIALWAGDNECDCSAYWMLLDDPANNILTRKILPEFCSRHDPGRPFLRSSPYITPGSVALHSDNPERHSPEQHLWGSRDYFKSDFYRLTRAGFVSEIGVPGCPAVSSMKRFLDPEYLWPDENNPQWNYHGSNPYGEDSHLYDFRPQLLRKHVELFFGFKPETVEEFALASQIYQAEAFKFLIELQRTTPKYTGILCWNLIDCWPQFSEAVVDYYFNRKLAFHYVRRSQQDLLVTVGEAVDWRREVVIVNDSCRSFRGRFSVHSVNRDEELIAARFEAAPCSIVRLPGFAGDPATRDLLLIRWETEDGVSGCNHVIAGMPHFDFRCYCEVWLPAIAGLDGAFDAARIAR